MFARFRLVTLAFAVVATTPIIAHTQQTTATRSVPAAGPRMDLTVTAMRQVAQTADSAAAQQRRRQNVGKPVALMIVGGAALVIGAVIGGDAGALFMIGGAVVGLIGLYQYLQ